MGEGTAVFLEQAAQRFDFSASAVDQIWHGLLRSKGRQVQFNSPELGGQGQWQNGMLMITDWNNHSLKTRLLGLINELAPRAVSQEMAYETLHAGETISRQEQSSTGLGTQEATTAEPEKTPMGGWQGTQNGVSYVFYPEQSLLVLNSGKRYSTAPYFVLGLGQNLQQGKNTLVLLTDQGEIPVDELTQID
ncbi:MULTISPECIES: hypothetical protein [unclassified Siphonobacter]|uniref:hypothetical protein n=1 Tax=unclassified Siphonobacter TaxID=2635712 RepID=UPI000CBC0C5A|nr:MULTISPECIES: hypothetical protein [unclassified Siphonobacter]MDQ1089455.1 hypothetical protein [Siphonobacter sp. SORGH_AS_1065]PKK37568.1 hypothetical protein BWI96_06840 [Siphonobacter sp. SORGH_AS_0500]